MDEGLRILARIIARQMVKDFGCSSTCDTRKDSVIMAGHLENRAMFKE